MDETSEYLPDSFSVALDNAVRKSWSEPQCERESLFLRESPMGTPTNHSLQASSSSSNFSSNRPEFSPRDDRRVEDTIGYYPVERHYSLTENTDESISDIFLDLDLGKQELTESDAHMRRPVPLRRSSIQDVQRVRQLLNPRSSFSGASSQEPQLIINSKLGWITILPDDHPEFITPIIVLNKSLLAVNSKYKLYVLYGGSINVEKLVKAGLETLNYRSYLSEELLESMHSSSRLILFIMLEKIFDLVCYLSPTSMVLENVDQLLDSKEIAEEIDNDTCLLLSNELPSTTENDEDIQVLILRPSSEVAMCITEFFTVYGKDEEDRRGKIASMNDCDVLRTLFDETWAHLTSREYSYTLMPSINEEISTYFKIVNFGLLKPWASGAGCDSENATKAVHSTLFRLLRIWRNFARSSEVADT
ncbi:hypothetical protein HG535_0C00720 [Zygotorulaspora mrakii]|uniref:Uncharacterized protein n=1 Tax=Zygotorulaspora mrakii TaxID=42260 RepID=A0A7H9AZR7_ZYGMR|nr:uncharacterized protein HG535_0C00720 [Zygotorulaspora mrakii]QLG71723.1 hypothetical protein HG535_0C00720 [Zygotorulaspora mrakii]